MKSLIERLEKSPRIPAWWRVKPDIVVIGGQKCGTSSLHFYLVQHPQWSAAREKEVHFFDRTHDRGEDWYALHFPSRHRVLGRRLRSGGPILHFEATPEYLYDPFVPERVKRMLPRARFIVLLRDPAKRAISQYQQALRRGTEALPAPEAFAEELRRIDEARAKRRLDDLLADRTHQQRAYCSRGWYAEQLRRWFDVFPRDRFLVLRSEDFFADTPRVLDRICDWAGVRKFTEAVPSPVLEVRNKGDYGKPDPAVVEDLRQHFLPHNAALAELLGRDFAWA